MERENNKKGAWQILKIFALFSFYLFTALLMDGTIKEVPVIEGENQLQYYLPEINSYLPGSIRGINSIDPNYILTLILLSGEPVGYNLHLDKGFISFENLTVAQTKVSRNIEKKLVLINLQDKSETSWSLNDTNLEYSYYLLLIYQILTSVSLAVFMISYFDENECYDGWNSAIPGLIASIYSSVLLIKRNFQFTNRNASAGYYLLLCFSSEVFFVMSTIFTFLYVQFLRQTRPESN